MDDEKHQDRVQAQDDEYPLVALKNIVAFPHNRQALPVAREKTIRALEEAMLRADHILAVSTQKVVDIDDPQPRDIHDVGTLVEVVTMHRQHEGNVQVLIRGIARIHIDQYIEQEPFLHVKVTRLPEEQTHGPQAEALVRHTNNLFERYAQLNRRFSVEDINSILALKSPASLSDTLATHLITNKEQQQDLLETLDPLIRLEKICVIMGNEIEILELEKTIRSRVRSQVDRSQKEFYLREQLRAIQEELGIEVSSEYEDLRARLKEKQLPREAALKVTKEIDRLERSSAQSAEVTVIRSYIDWMLALPWNERSEDTFSIEQARHILDTDHYGLEIIKERILEFLAVRQLRMHAAARDGLDRPSTQGQILCFIGPPGVGKTTLGQSIAKALHRTFVRMSLGGVHDEAEIRGHRRTYIGALPGRIIQSMKTAGVRNPVFLLDEIDKISSEYRGDPAAALLEVLDPSQNGSFTDHYLELPFDLSEVFFICTGNNKYQIPRALADRMDIIELPGYTLEEKVNIGMKHLFPSVVAEHGLRPEQLKVSQAVMQLIVMNYTREAGVRNLDRQLASICRKVARRVLEKPGTHVRLTAHNLENYLGAPRYSSIPQTNGTQVGTAMGLAWTEMGGILLPVEVVTMLGKGDLLITGQLGDVMRESVIAALSYTRTRAATLHIDPGFQDTTDLHIHLPENAIPKDGPSAGITIATALVSALTHRPVHSDLAMTGEVTLMGNVLPIGGLKEKVLAAQQANIHSLILPAANEKDLAEIPIKARQQIHFIFVHTMDEVIEAALMNEPENKDTDSMFHEALPLHLDELPAAMNEHQHLSRMTSKDRESTPHSRDEGEFIPPSSDELSKHSYSSAFAEKDDQN